MPNNNTAAAQIDPPTDYRVEYATAADFDRWNLKAEGMSLAELDYAIADCREAYSCAEEIRSGGGGRYLDELNTYQLEITLRKYR